MAALMLLVAAPVAAQQAGPFPGSPVDRATMRLGERVEELFDNGEYERAFFIYRNELAPIGDKYAQYMVGFMYETGTWVEEDPVLASAWYRLAAERGYQQFEQVRDGLLNSLTDVDQARSDELYLQLRREYSDVVLLLDLIEQDVAAMTARTGSRISGGTGPVTIVDPRAGYVVRLRNDVAGLGGTERFLKSTLGGGYYYSVAEDWTLAARGEVGNVFGIGQDTRIANRFFIGGTTCRGFQFAGVGPRDELGEVGAAGGPGGARGGAQGVTR